MTHENYSDEVNLFLKSSQSLALALSLSLSLLLLLSLSLLLPSCLSLALVATSNFKLVIDHIVICGNRVYAKTLFMKCVCVVFFLFLVEIRVHAKSRIIHWKAT